MADKRFSSLKEFYPFYLTEHQDSTCRKLHFVGTSLLPVVAVFAFFQNNPWYYLLIPLVGYSFAWVGHFFFEKNKPATIQYPLYSLASDFILFWELLIGKQKFNPDTK